MIKYIKSPQMPSSHQNSIDNPLTVDEQIEMYLGMGPYFYPKYQPQLNDQQDLYICKIQECSPTNSQIAREILEEGCEESRTKVMSRKSCHHNLQKHTVTALRDIIKLGCFQTVIGGIQCYRKGYQLWKQFLTIRGKQVMTKKFLSVLFSPQPESIPMLKQYGFKTIFTRMNDTQILQAKKQLKFITLSLLTDKAINQHIKRRQIKKKIQFSLYLKHFRNQLESDNLKKRISKQISNQLKLQICYNQENQQKEMENRDE